MGVSVQPKHFLKLIGQQSGERGRNTKYDPDLHPQMVRDLAQAGEFPEAWLSEIGVTPETMRIWAREHDEMREALIIARILLQTFWTREIAANRDNPNARPGLYALIMRRFRDLYGREGGVDLVDWFIRTEAQVADGAGPVTQPEIPTAQRSTNDLERRLEALRKRDAAYQRRDE